MNDQIIIGKRIPIGAIVGALITAAAITWDATHPESPVPAGLVSALSTVLVGITQIIVVNFFGVTGGQE